MMYRAPTPEIIPPTGLFDWYDGIRKPENQWDLTQVYVGCGDSGGNRPGCAWASSSTSSVTKPSPNHGRNRPTFIRARLIFFNYPFTHTGIIGTYDITKDVTSTSASPAVGQSIDGG